MSTQQRDIIYGPNYGLKEAAAVRRRANQQANGSAPEPYDLGFSVPFLVRIDLEESHGCQVQVAHLADPKDVFSLLHPERAEEMVRVIQEIMAIKVRPVSAKRIAELEAEQAHFENLEKTYGQDFLTFTK